MANKRYGWKPDLPDHRDLIYAVSRVQPLPSVVDLRPQCPPVYDQRELGSCTANASAAAFEFDLKKQKAADFVPSRLFIYYNERAIEHSVSDDSGAMIRDGIKSLNKLGVCPESMWPYSDENPGPFQRKPTKECFDEALKHQLQKYMRVPRTLTSMRSCLAAGFPFVFGFTVYEGFESAAVAKSGVLNMPTPAEGTLGGHAVMCAGYDDAAQRFVVRNSWGTQWGQAGYFTMPYAYLLDDGLSDDFWTLRTVET